MGVTVIVGVQWGDEGKGKLTHFLGRNYDLVMRFQGGSNAGHTVFTGGKTYKFNLLPSAILHKNVQCLLADGVVVNPWKLLEEIENLKRKDLWHENLLIGSGANLVMPYHVLLDELEEKRLGEKAVGTTKRGVGPAYSDKYARLGIQVGDIFRRDYLRERLITVLEQKNVLIKELYRSEQTLNPEEIMEELISVGQKIKPFVVNTVRTVRQAIDSGKEILCEGAQGALLDIDYGTYPFVTCSHSITAGACLGTGISPRELERIIGVLKAYTTRVGSGSFPTAQENEIGERMRERGAEFGTATGRPRRCGWLDLVLVKYAVQINGCTELAITKVDVLDGLREVKACIAYKVNGIYSEIPVLTDIELSNVEPVYETFAGWEGPTAEAKSFDELPKELIRFLEFIESFVGVPIRIISLGKDTEQTISRS